MIPPRRDTGVAYYIPTGPGEAEYVEKRSRFLGKVRGAASEAEARAFVDAVKKQYHDARHNCWCWRLKNGEVRYSDDGEPQGTAGQPMLEVLEREEVTDAVCVVTRYFGGILLGAGPLLRAYQGTAKRALDAAGMSAVRRWVRILIPCAYPLFQRVSMEVAAWDGIVTGTEYGAGVTVHALLPAEALEGFCERIVDLSAGKVQVQAAGEEFRAAPIRERSSHDR